MRLKAFDVETDGVEREYALQPFRAGVGPMLQNNGVRQAWLSAYATAEYVEGEVVTDGELKPDVETLRNMLTDAAANNITIVGWNTPFDVAWLIALGLRDEVYACRWLDAMLLYKHLVVRPTFIPGPPQLFGLKKAVEDFGLDGDYSKDVDFHEADAEDPIAWGQTLLAYNKLDAGYTLQLARQFLDSMSPDVKRNALIEAATIPLVAETYVRGIYMDQPALAALDSKLLDVSRERFVRLKLTEPSVTPEILASPKQLSTLLYETWQLTPPKFTDKGQPSTDKEALDTLAARDGRAQLLREYREAVNNRTKFAIAPQLSLDYNDDGCTRPSFRIYGTYTGRGTYSSKIGRGKGERATGVALHQWKRDPEFRATIKAPPGYTLLEFDFSGQEFRWMAVLSTDPTMISMCQPGEDAHSFMGGQVASVSYEAMLQGIHAGDKEIKSFRQLGKVANLSCQYRTSPATLQRVAKVQYGLTLEFDQARVIHSTYQRTYTRVPEYWRRQVADAGRQGYVSTPAGRRINLGLKTEWDQNWRWSYESTAINFPVQGAGADQKYLALLALKDYLAKVDGRFYFELHDGMFIVVPDQYAERAAHEVRHLLSNLPYRKAWGVDFPVQFPVDAKMGPSWGELKEVA